MFKKSFAFTLAEVLITLGIIGVVAALTIPSLLVNLNKRQTVVKLQRAVSVVTQGFKQSGSELGPLTDDIVKTKSPAQIYKVYVLPYISSTPCYTYSECGYDKAQPFTTSNGQRSQFSFYSPSNLGFYASDGFLYIYQTIGGSGQIEHGGMYVDINGPKLPNTFGIDVFSMAINKDENWYMACSSKTDEEVNKNCSSSGTGECCAEKIRRAGWKIESDYPWKN